jgi:hypothetical protein
MKTRITQPLAAAVVAALMGLATTAQAQLVYDFNNLNPGNLAGQDGWYHAYSGDGYAAVTTGVGINTTKVAGVASG